MAERFVIPDDLVQSATREKRGDWLAELPVLVPRIAAELRIEVGAPFLPEASAPGPILGLLAG